MVATHGLFASWCLGDGSRLTLLANLGGEPWTPEMAPNGRLLHATVDGLPTEGCPTLTGWVAAWYLAESGR